MRNMRKVPKSAGLIIILISVCIFGGLLYLVISYDQARPHYFHHHRRGIATSLYNQIMELDLVNDYPATPERVMDINNKIFLLLHGNMLMDDRLIESLLVQQRHLYTDEILENLDFDTQYEHWIEMFNSFREYGTTVFEISMDSPVRHPLNNNMLTVEVTKFTNNLGNLRWIYALERADEYSPYKIANWVNTGS